MDLFWKNYKLFFKFIWFALHYEFIILHKSCVIIYLSHGMQNKEKSDRKLVKNWFIFNNFYIIFVIYIFLQT